MPDQPKLVLSCPIITCHASAIATKRNQFVASGKCSKNYRESV